jgi:transcriptional regulator with XRE-family HTH domain
VAHPPLNAQLAQHIGHRIAQLISESGKTQSETSYDLRVPPAMLSRWSSGASIPSVENLIRIAEHFGVSADWLLGLSGTRHHVAVRARTVDEIVAMSDELISNPPPPRERSNRRRS